MRMCESARVPGSSIYSKIKFKKSHFQYKLYEECGFLYLRLQCSRHTRSQYSTASSTVPDMLSALGRHQ
eukprot:626758-Rhodomonas_salina.2